MRRIIILKSQKIISMIIMEFVIKTNKKISEELLFVCIIIIKMHLAKSRQLASFVQKEDTHKSSTKPCITTLIQVYFTLRNLTNCIGIKPYQIYGGVHYGVEAFS